jgi:hypothetical protein
MPEPDIDGVLDDYSRQQQPVDETGFHELVTMLTAAKQVKDAARAAGFSEEEGFQFSRDFAREMWVAAGRAATGD